MKNLWKPVLKMFGFSTGVLLILSSSIHCTLSFQSPKNLSGSSLDSAAFNALAKDRPLTAVLSPRQILNSMLSVTGVTADNTINNEFDTRSGQFPTDHGLSQLTGSFNVAVTNLAGTVCDNMIQKEAKATADKRIFTGSIDYSKNLTQQSSSAWITVSSLMARNFLGRELGAAEVQMFQDEIDGFTADLAANEKTDTKYVPYLATYLCAAQLSTVSFLTH